LSINARLFPKKTGQYQLETLYKPNTDKPHYGNTPFELPDGWAWVRLEHISRVIQYGLNNSAENSGNFRLLRITDIQDDKVDWNNVPFTTITNDQALEFKLETGDILFARTGATVGKSYIVSKITTSAVFASYLIRVKTMSIYSQYIKHFFGSGMYWEQIIDKSVGIGQPNVNGTKLKELILPIPPLAEQHRIVTAIESAFAVIDEIERDKTDLQSAVAAAKRKILSLAVSGKLVPEDPGDEPASVLLERIRSERETLAKAGKTKRGKTSPATATRVDTPHYGNIGNKRLHIDGQTIFNLPKTWEWYKLSSLWDLLSGRDLTPSEYSAHKIGIPYITGASNFTDKDLLINRWTDCPKVIAKNGDLLITCKGTVGTMKINTQGDVHIARQIMAIKNRVDLNAEFLMIVLTSFVTQITLAAKGIIPGISREDLLDMLIPLPPLAEQRRIVTAIETAFEQLDAIATLLA